MRTSTSLVRYKLLPLPPLTGAAAAGASASSVDEAAAGRGSAAGEPTFGCLEALQAAVSDHQVPDGETLPVPPGPADTGDLEGTKYMAKIDFIYPISSVCCHTHLSLPSPPRRVQVPAVSQLPWCLWTRHFRVSLRI